MLDTNICIFIMKEDTIVLDKLKTVNFSDICISAISLSELEYGVFKSQQYERNRKILNRFIKYYKRVDLSIREKISEIKYDPNEFDEDRFLLYMDDGNSVYITITKFERLNYYNDVLPQLDGKKGYLYLDSGNHFQIMQ